MATWRPGRLTTAQLEERRRSAARLFRGGRLNDAQIARQLGVTRAAVGRWRQAWRHGGMARLAARPKSGRPPRLSAAQWRRLAKLIERGARAAGFDTERWTLRRIAAVIERAFGVRYHPRYLERPLKAHGFSVQRPATRARERDEYVIARWPTRDWIALKKKARRRRATIVLVDETGHSFGARTGLTWARRGQTPLLRRTSKRREVSSVVGITPDGRLAARHVRGAVTSAVVIATLRYFRRRLGPRLLIIWDRLNAHRARATQRFLAEHADQLAVAFLPAYAPELNPEEQCNAWVKRDMQNALPATVDELASLALLSVSKGRLPPPAASSRHDHQFLPTCRP
jgi:transposase